MKKIIFDLDIYSYQLNCVGQVHNVAYINWMEIGWLKMLDAVGLQFSTMVSQGTIPSLTHTIIACNSPLFLGDRVWIEMWLSSISCRSVVMRFNFFKVVTNADNIRDQILVAEGCQKNRFIDKESFKPRPFTSKEKNAFSPYLKAHHLAEAELLTYQT